MATNTLSVRMKQAVRTEAEWTSDNPVLLAGEVAYSSDKNNMYKVGDGTSTWSNLSYNMANAVTGVKGNSESTYRTGNINITATNIGLGNVTNNKQVKGLSSGTTSGHVVTWGSDGYTVADSGYTIGKSVPSDAVFTDTTYSDATTSVHGLMSTTDKTKLDGIATNADVTSLILVGESASNTGTVYAGNKIGIHNTTVSVDTGNDATITIDDASTSQKGIVQLSDSTSSTSTTLAATANAVKQAYERGSVYRGTVSINTSTNVATLTGLSREDIYDAVITNSEKVVVVYYDTTNGDFYYLTNHGYVAGWGLGLTFVSICDGGVNSTLKRIVCPLSAVNTTTSFTGSYSEASISDASISDATTTTKGIVQLSDATDSTSSTLAATANAVRKAYDHGGVTSVNGNTGAVTVTVPTKVSDLNNDSGFITSIPTASSNTLGGIKVGSGLSIANDGTLSSTGGSGSSDVVITYSSDDETIYITTGVSNGDEVSY